MYGGYVLPTWMATGSGGGYYSPGVYTLFTKPTDMPYTLRPIGGHRGPGRGTMQLLRSQPYAGRGRIVL